LACVDFTNGKAAVLPRRTRNLSAEPALSNFSNAHSTQHFIMDEAKTHAFNRIIERPTLTVGFWTKPPLSLAVLKLTQQQDEVECCEDPLRQDPVFKIQPDLEIYGDHTITRYFARCRPQFMLYEDGGEDSAIRAAEIDQYLAVCGNYSNANSEDLKVLLDHLEARLVSRTYLVGHRLSIADVGIWILLIDVPIDQDNLPNVVRWASHISSNSSLSDLKDQMLQRTSR
jgi:hypothetical protein